MGKQEANPHIRISGIDRGQTLFVIKTSVSCLWTNVLIFYWFSFFLIILLLHEMHEHGFWRWVLGIIKYAQEGRCPRQGSYELGV